MTADPLQLSETGYYDEPPRRIPAALLLLALLVAVGVIAWMVRR